jgi:hypothetical protein
MHAPSRALWRIAFRTNLTRSDAPTTPMAYLLEAHWAEERIRWLGLLFRRRLMPPEVALVNTETWPELKGELEPFMKGVFEQAWLASGKTDEALGSAALATLYHQQSALSFAVADQMPDLGKKGAIESFGVLYEHLLGLRDYLKPMISAPVVPLGNREEKVPTLAPTRPDVELLNQAA